MTMREIKFRGKNERGFWEFGNLHVDKHTYDFSQNLYYIIRHCFVPTLTMPAANYVQVKTETVGQYTGLKDAKGVEVYEGDIVKYNFKFTSIVTWGEKSHGYRLKVDKTKTEKWGKVKYYKLPNSNCIEVIGNIHDTPNLLTDNK